MRQASAFSQRPVYAVWYNKHPEQHSALQVIGQMYVTAQKIKSWRQMAILLHANLHCMHSLWVRRQCMHQGWHTSPTGLPGKCRNSSLSTNKMYS